MSEKAEEPETLYVEALMDAHVPDWQERVREFKTFAGAAAWVELEVRRIERGGRA